MTPIQMADLKKQYLQIKPQVDAAIQEVLDTSAFINGKPVQLFATALQNYLKVRHVIPCANGTDALQIAMMALNLQPGDEVITPSFTYIATVEVAALLKLKPVFAEVDPRTFCLDITAIEKLITPRTKAIVPVHLYGQSADMESLLALAQKYNLAIIEDNAQAIGCDYFFSDGSKKKTGTIGAIGATSFFPSKNLGCYGDGGAIFTNDDDLAKKMRMIANHGQRIKYHFDMVGCNSRLDTLQAAVLQIKLKYLDEYIAARQAVADYYDKAFANNNKIITPYRAKNSTHVFHQYTLQLNNVDRNELRDYLAQKNIPSMIYYPIPCHRQKMFDNTINNISLPLTDSLSERVLSLPIHTEMDKEQLQFIATAVLEFVQ